MLRREQRGTEHRAREGKEVQGDKEELVQTAEEEEDSLCHQKLADVHEDRTKLVTHPVCVV